MFVLVVNGDLVFKALKVVIRKALVKLFNNSINRHSPHRSWMKYLPISLFHYLTISPFHPALNPAPGSSGLRLTSSGKNI
jgi:hypothetical protein